MEIPGGGSGGHVIEDDTYTFTQRSKLQFLGDVTVEDDEAGDRTIIAVGKSGYDYIETVANVITWDASTGLKKLGIISNNATIKFENLQNGMDGFMKLEVQANDVGIDFDSGVTMFLHGEN